MNKSGLTIRLGVVVILAALSIGLIFSQVFFRIVYLNELENSQKNIEQLSSTVSSTLSVATYLDDAELAEDVITGLMTNDIVSSVAISTDKKKITSSNYQDTDNAIVFNINSPFEKNRVVGKLSITPNTKQIAKRADTISWKNQVTITLQATLITLVVIIVTYILVTQPIISLAKNLHKLSIGTDERVAIPKFHNKSEIGLLASDVNVLLDKMTYQIIEERKLRQQVENLSRHFKLLFESSNSPIVLSEPSGNIVLYNKAFSLLLKRLNVPLKQSFGPYLRELFQSPEELDRLVEISLANDEIAAGEFILDYQDNNKPVWVQTIVTATVTEDYREYYQLTLHDISLRRQELEQLDLKAHRDQLTQLLNRRGAKQQINQLIAQQKPFALLLLDLNKFKPINDLYGHDAGDEILKQVGATLTKCLRRKDIFARWGGDEFVIILPKLTHNEVRHVCEKIITTLEKPYILTTCQKSVTISASTGVSFYPQDSRTIESLLKFADKAMYQVKEDNLAHRQVVFYDELILPGDEA